MWAYFDACCFTTVNIDNAAKVELKKQTKRPA
jgi:hypothetical protein